MEPLSLMSQRRMDMEVIKACQAGDRDAFRVLFETYKDKVYSIALYFFNGEDASAKDITQQVFLKLITGVSQFRYDAEFSTWLYRLVVNACMDEQRKRRRLVFFGDIAPVKPMSTTKPQEAHYSQLETIQTIQAMIA